MASGRTMLESASPMYRRWAEELFQRAETDPRPEWAVHQQGFLDLIDQYLQEETTKSPETNIESHEAGGHLRVAFPQMAVREDESIRDYLRETMLARKAHTDEELFHGYPDEAEIHHEIETFLYFQVPLLLEDHPGNEIALESVEDVAHHVGNWESEVPDWYDWESHGFRSTSFGTKSIRDSFPDDFQHGNHFRFIKVALATYLKTDEQRYLDVVTDYADRWCEHIESHRDDEYIPLYMYPAGRTEQAYNEADSRWAGHTAPFVREIVPPLQDIYRVTGEAWYLENSRRLLDTFLENGAGSRPALVYDEEGWHHNRGTANFVDPHDEANWEQGVGASRWYNSLAWCALRHDMVTGDDYYEDAILQWADQVDETSYPEDLMVTNLLIAAHYYSGEERYLTRAHEKALRLWSVTEDNQYFHQCELENRHGSKSQMLSLYQPLLGCDWDWSTSGCLPIRLLRHDQDGACSLPEEVSFRLWRGDGDYRFEAINEDDSPAEWDIVPPEPLPKLETECPEQIHLQGVETTADNRIRVGPTDRVSGQIILEY